ncbi:MAG: hypothetical protein A4E65_00127 [Syntrophorhabdus sp. PtaU1.Bin153]|nr:MAG: hypothetical protein A4E65_00127 [Syntrophorhabdus sp. PtaU1.Bin153]
MNELQLEIEKHLERIERMLPRAYKLTLVARHVEMPEDKNADIVLTLDDPNKVIDAIRRLFPIPDPMRIGPDLKKQGLMDDRQGRIPHVGFPYSRDWLDDIKCKRVSCISNTFGMCCTPSRCEIDEGGKCAGYVMRESQP